MKKKRRRRRPVETPATPELGTFEGIDRAVDDLRLAAGFRVGMKLSGPPEMFGLPPDPGCASHATGTPGCAECYPPRAPVTVTAVDPESGSIALNSAPTPTRMKLRPAKDYPEPGLYNFNELMKRRFPL